MGKGKKLSAASLAKSSLKKETKQFPIVGIGASAGGLEAIEQFLENANADSGMAYVVIQHLDPTQKGMLPELLQHVTKMKVYQVTDHLIVEPNCVYVIPPNKTMSVLNGELRLFKPVEARGLRLPIDFFLNSLADQHHEFAVGVILSGMGSDGTIGIGSIKEKHGIVMVQDPTTAKFDSMPRNAIDSVQVDIVAPANELPVLLHDLFKHKPIEKSVQTIDYKNQSALDKIITILRNRTGNDFSMYKKNTVYRRIERRMQIHKINKITAYVDFLKENPKEVDILLKELLIGVTNFFRDPLVWEKLTDTVIPDKLEKLKEGSTLRAWVAGCSTGEEAYSLAIAFKEALAKKNPHGGISLQIFATDLDNEAIETARKGVFHADIAAHVSEKRLSRFFVKIDDGYRINSEIREMLVFAKHNIIQHPPFTKIDFLFCRNLLIYIDTELQKKILGLFYYSMSPNGTMVLGSSESLGSQGHLFEPIDSKLKIYARTVTSAIPNLIDFPSSFSHSRIEPTESQDVVSSHKNIQALADQMLLEHFSPPGVLVNVNGDIVYISGHTGKYLEPAVGKANLNIFAMLREGLQSEFLVAFRRVVMKKEAVVLRNMKTNSHDETKTINIEIQWLDKPAPLKGLVMIIFKDVESNAIDKIHTTKRKKTSNLQAQKEEELQWMRENIQRTLEEVQYSQEELKSTNEELQSANEELQSANEELTTSKEEMQSLNEELQTVNAELQSKIDDYSRVNNDMKNLLNSIDIATLFLDKDLNIRRYTNQTTKIFNLIKSDIGRPFTDLTSELSYLNLASDAREVIKTLVVIEKQIPTKDKRWFTVRIMPYRTLDDRIDGLVITFVNTSDIRQLEGELQETAQMHRFILNSSSDVIIRLSTDFKIVEFNFQSEQFFGTNRELVINNSFIQLFVPEAKQKKAELTLREKLEQYPYGKLNMPVIAKGDKVIEVEWLAEVLLNNMKMPAGIIIITKNKSYE
ncbi:MAG: chemotaxis protein CheB [Bacteroidales bacterium]|nr:chemotaxis protein CheB [Bacteroidales bacterium]